ncbi:formate/nitrite transporter family protein [Prosthecomicrobium sp. N25]|uniref:formate/nitrite transporter family protein n=1 Tax=Prosthecomicrobium sp. N25 TaxID=3129254 RepID=UPI003078398C
MNKPARPAPLPSSPAAPGPLPLGPTGIEAYRPAEMAERVEAAGVAKAKLPVRALAMLGTLAGAFIAFGAMFYTLVATGAGDGFGPVRLLGGVAFSLGLILVVVGGAELFTGNALIVMAWVDRKVTTAALLRNWGIVFVANLAGALGVVMLAHMADFAALGGGGVGRTAAKIAEAKVALAPGAAFARAILCNALVCLAVWLTFAARDVGGKILAILWPITGFVAMGFEHSVANMYLIPAGWLAGGAVTAGGFLENLALVSVGNLVGGAGGVALSYWAIYLDKDR